MVVLYAASLPMSMAGMEIFGWVTFLLYFMLYFDREDLLELRPLKLPITLLGLFLIHTLISAAINSAGHLEDFLRIFGETRFILLFLLWILVHRRFGKGLQPTLLKAIAAFSLIGGLYAVLQTYTGYKFPQMLPSDRTINFADRALYRGSGFFQTPLTFAHAYGLFFAFYFSLLIKKFSFQTKSVKWSVLAQVLGIIHSFTRGVWLAVAATSVAVVSSLGRKALAYTVGGILVVGIIATSASPVFRGRLASVIDFTDFGFLTRLDLWKANLHMAVTHPVFGVGLTENHKHLKATYNELGIKQDFVSHAHNNILELLGGSGFVGGFLLLAAYGAIAWLLWKNRNPLSAAALAVMLQLFLSGFVEANFFDDEVNHIFHFFLAMGLASFLKPADTKLRLVK
jgi:O-antigen ligase